MKTADGVIGTLTASWSYVAGGDNSTVIYGEKATLRLEDDPVYSLIVQYGNGETVNYELGQIQTNEAGGQTNTHVIDHFVDSIIQNTEPLINGDEGKKSLEVILAALESSANKENYSIKYGKVIMGKSKIITTV